jgi:hypothetical protein
MPARARRNGLRIWHSLPDDESSAWAERVPGSTDDALRPDFSCTGCGHAWVDAPLPPWVATVCS